MVIAGSGDLVALDAKMSFDTNAMNRQPKIAELRDRSQEDARESTAADHGLSYVGLDGASAASARVLGLAMTRLAMIKLAGGAPASFLDIAGGASPERVARAFRTVLADGNVSVILSTSSRASTAAALGGAGCRAGLPRGRVDPCGRGAPCRHQCRRGPRRHSPATGSAGLGTPPCQPPLSRFSAAEDWPRNSSTR